MTSLGFNSVNTTVSMMGNTSKMVIAKQKNKNTAGKIIGGLTAYGVVAPVINKSLLTKALPKISNVFTPVAEAFKSIPLFKGVVDMDKLMNFGEKVTKLSSKHKAVMVAILALSTIATIIAGAKIGGSIQDKIKSPQLPKGLIA